MAFADALQRAQDPARTRRHMCAIVTLRAGLSPEDAEALTAALLDPTIPGSVISAALKEEGLAAQPNAINRHRNLRCTCESV